MTIFFDQTKVTSSIQDGGAWVEKTNDDVAQCYTTGRPFSLVI